MASAPVDNQPVDTMRFPAFLSFSLSDLGSTPFLLARYLFAVHRRWQNFLNRATAFQFLAHVCETRSSDFGEGRSERELAERQVEKSGLIN